MEFIKDNYEWLFSGFGVTVILAIWGLIWKKKKTEEANVTNNANVVINNNVGQTASLTNSTINGNHADNNRLKDTLRILFVDDEHTKFKMVSILKKAGWRNTKSIKDITDLDDPKAVEADFIFVDINGVGTTLFEDQGLGLASALKKKYPDKIVIIYSDESTGDRFHKALREVDDCLPKNAEPYQFINLLESLSK